MDRNLHHYFNKVWGLHLWCCRMHSLAGGSELGHIFEIYTFAKR